MKFQASFDGIVAYIIFLSTLIFVFSITYERVANFINTNKEGISLNKARMIFYNLTYPNYVIDIKNIQKENLSYRFSYKIVGIDLPQIFYGNTSKKGVYTLGNALLINASDITIFLTIPKDCFLNSTLNYTAKGDFYFVEASNAFGKIDVNSSCLIFIESNDNFYVNNIPYENSFGAKLIYYTSYSSFSYIKNGSNMYLARVRVDAR